MAIINNLALSMGGGIISLKQQAKQAENTVSILIGLYQRNKDTGI